MSVKPRLRRWAADRHHHCRSCDTPRQRPHAKAIFGSSLEKLCTSLATQPRLDIPPLSSTTGHAVVNWARQLIGILDGPAFRGAW